jgi:NADPH:quinone reductase
MRAIIVREFGGPDVLKLEDVPDPIARAGQMVIKVHAVGVNPIDTYIRNGAYGAGRTVPYTPGMDAAGVVESVGDGVTNWQIGDRVYMGATLTGGYAEKTLADASQVFRLPDNLSFSEGAGINVPYATAYRALLQRARGKAGETVLVHGASGGVGIACVQLARLYGFRVVGTASTQIGRDLVKAQGAHFVFDHHPSNSDYLQSAVAFGTNGRGFDVILEMLANVNLNNDLGALAPNGRVIVIGNRGKIEIDPRLTMGKDSDIRGMSLFNASPAELSSIHHGLYAGFESGALRPVVGKEFPLEDAKNAHVAILEPGSYGKIVLVCLPASEK